MFGRTSINSQQVDYEKFLQENRDIVAYVKKSM
jgi:hypothetical protein